MSFETNAMIMRGAGGPEVLEPGKLALDWDAEGADVLVRMEAAAINPADLYFREYGPYLGEAKGCVLGHDGAGVVEQVGKRAKGVAVGDRVAFCNGGVGGAPGTYARHAVVPAALVAKVPVGVTTKQAAAVALVFITGWEAFKERAGLRKGEQVLVHGGAGGTGHIAIQIAKALGARVAATVSSDEKAEIARAAGAEKIINYREEDFVAAALDWTGGRGVDAVLDNAGPEVFQASIRTLAPYGRLVTLMGTPGDLEDMTAYNMNLTIHNVMMLTPMWKGLMAHRRRQARVLETALNWLAEGKVRVNIAAEYPLEQVAEAHRALGSEGGRGKIVLTM
ncbi:MAG: zinc-binding dehydrogenase [Paracoccaceae bacterium]|nr:zinc-binding dehydrogenase [Paracoccaceae bacterium]